ncbi:MAG: DUF3488 and transglutaminase-like domain-containing protein [Oscillospiraceae bacterium]|jgi:hypothetical protein|nr:DUF3488 and transglutaminase-like domain-containing protein [Oscillospiraceae bacterium]
MRDSVSGFSLSFPSAGDRSLNIGRKVTAVLLFLGLSGCLWRALGLAGGNMILPLCVGCAYCLVSCGLSGKHWYVYLAAVIIPAAFVLLAGKLVLEGWNVTLNQVFLRFEGYFGRIYPRYEVSAEVNQSLCASAFLLLPTVLLAVLCGRATTGGAWRFSATLLTAAIWVAALVFRIALPLIWVAALIVAFAATFPVARRHSAKRRVAVGGSASVWILAAVALLTAIAIIPALAVGGAGGNADSARRAAARAVHSVRYETSGKVLPEGDLRELADFAASEGTVLRVTAESAGNYYLRGFVGEVYVGDGWTELTSARRGEYATLFSWLHDRGFYGQNQYALLTRVLGSGGETSEILIENTGECAEFVFAPYEVVGNDADKARIGDENLRAEGLRGQREYALNASVGSAANYEQLYALLTAARGREEPSAIEYLTSENAYRDFVYENYLEIPEQARASLARFLSGLDLPEGKIAFADALLVVNTYLDTLTYTEQPEFAYEGGDFLTYFLEDGREGDSVHFATAAALIFRYLGVPARYVEGYRIVGADGGAVEVSGKNAAAWTEIYRDGVGFVPFEADLMNRLPPIAEDVRNDTQDQPPTEVTPPNSPLNLLSHLLPPLLLLLLLLLAGFTILAIRRAIKLRRLSGLLGVADNAAAVGYATTYLIRVLAHAGILYERGSLSSLRAAIEDKFGGALGAEYEAVICVQQAALFGRRQIADHDRASVSRFLEDVIKRVKAQNKLYGRFRLKWVECVY